MLAESMGLIVLIVTAPHANTERPFCTILPMLLLIKTTKIESAASPTPFLLPLFLHAFPCPLHSCWSLYFHKRSLCVKPGPLLTGRWWDTYPILTGPLSHSLCPGLAVNNTVVQFFTSSIPPPLGGGHPPICPALLP